VHQNTPFYVKKIQTFSGEGAQPPSQTHPPAGGRHPGGLQLSSAGTGFSGVSLSVCLDFRWCLGFTVSYQGNFCCLTVPPCCLYNLFYICYMLRWANRWWLMMMMMMMVILASTDVQGALTVSPNDLIYTNLFTRR